MQTDQGTPAWVKAAGKWTAAVSGRDGACFPLRSGLRVVISSGDPGLCRLYPFGSGAFAMVRNRDDVILAQPVANGRQFAVHQPGPPVRFAFMARAMASRAEAGLDLPTRGNPCPLDHLRAGRGSKGGNQNGEDGQPHFCLARLM